MGRTSTAQDDILRAAADLFYAQGYHAVGVQEICAAAGVNKGSFYHFFPSKRALALAVIDRWAGQLNEASKRTLNADRPPLDKLRDFLQPDRDGPFAFMLAGECVRGCPIGNLALELAARDPEIRERLAHVFKRLARMFEGPIRQAMAEGDLPPSDPVGAAHALVAYVEGVMVLAKTKNDPRVVARLAGGAFRLLGLNDGAPAAKGG